MTQILNELLHSSESTSQMTVTSWKQVLLQTTISTWAKLNTALKISRQCSECELDPKIYHLFSSQIQLESRKTWML